MQNYGKRLYKIVTQSYSRLLFALNKRIIIEQKKNMINCKNISKLYKIDKRLLRNQYSTSCVH